MSDESDFDDDIDKLLDEIDSAGTKGKPSSTTTAKPTTKPPDSDPKPETVSEPKLTLKSDGIGLTTTFAGGASGGFKLSDLKKGPQSPIKEAGKSVRFPQNADFQTGTGNAGTPNPTFLSNLLGSKETFKGASEPALGSATASGNAAAKSVLQSSKSDWLGLRPSEDFASTALNTAGANKLDRNPYKGDSGPNSLTNKFTGNDEMLKSMGFDPKDVRSSNPGPGSGPSSGGGPTNKPAASSVLKPRGGFDLEDDFWPKAAAQPKSSILSTSTDKPESSFRSTLLQKAAASSANMPKSEQESPFESLKTPQFNPTSSGQKSIVDVLPFLSRPKTDPPVAESSGELPEPGGNTVQRSVSPAAPANTGGQTIPVPSGGGKTVRVVKKTVQARSASPAVALDRPTLQLPSHLVDEDELKSMCTSLKSLYSTQLEMQEKSYQEQLDCLAQSHHRKEELLREEIKLLHKDYEARLERLKNELVETETKLPQRFHTELESMQRLHQQVMRVSTVMSHGNDGNELYSPRELSTKPSVGLLELEKIVEEKMTIVASTLSSAITKAQQESVQGQRKEFHDMENKLESLQKKLDAFTKFKVEEESKKSMMIIESDRRLKDEVSRLHKSQKKVRDSVVKAAVATISQTLQMMHADDSHKKEKITSQLKEFRKDVRRILYDLEAKNDQTLRSHTNMESEQKNILKCLQELQNNLQAYLARGNMMNPSMEMFTISNAVSAAKNSSKQVQEAELEIKLLREERNSLSESIAEMNVQRRKLNEERLNLEKDRMEFERDKNKLRDYEVQLRVKIAEAEDMKKHCEEIRKLESSKSMEATMKMQEIDKERSKIREQLHEAEQNLRMREGKLIQEKTELMREKDFVEKLRDQLLCPGCLKSANQFALASRSDGDGLDISLFSTATLDASKSANANVPLPGLMNLDSPHYYSKDSLHLDDLYFKQFHGKKS